MPGWRTALLASLLSGTALARTAPRDDVPSIGDLDPADAVSALASDLDRADPSLALGLDVRAAHLGAVETPSGSDLVIAGETLGLLAPLAGHVGMSARRAALEDASFRVLDRDSYERLSRDLPASPEQDRALVDHLLADTRALLSEHGIEAAVTGRTKSLYSVHRKMERKGLELDEVLDRTGLRVRVETVDQCYRVLDLLHQRHEAVPGTMDDYIAHPKPSGYRSLHTAVRVDPDRRSVEFQVRTHAMHAEAEAGEAAHWRYKLG